jgi:hypothetical protein
MKKCVLLLLVAALASCNNGDDDASDFYPNILTEFAMIRTDDAGTMIELTTDNEQTYTITNPQEGYDKNANYRAVCGYVADGHKATLYHATGAYMLRDSTQLAYDSEPVKVTSVWQSGRYINLHLSPLTQGGTQYWGYRIDETSGNTTHISLHHKQNGDPLSYTTTVYASFCIDEFESIPAGNLIALHIKTFDGEKVSTFKKH